MAKQADPTSPSYGHEAKWVNGMANVYGCVTEFREI
jgi:hypothetical protein